MNNLTEHVITVPGTEKRKGFLQSIFSRTKEASLGTVNQSPIPEQPSLILCLSIESLLFTDWIKCACDKDYSSLIIAGTPTADELTTAWITLMSQYHTVTGSKEAESHVELSRKIEAMNTKILHVSCLVEALKLGFIEELAAELRDTWEYKLPFTPESLESNLQKVTNKLANDKTKLAIWLKQYRDEQEQQGTGDTEAMTKEKYMQTLYAIEESKGMEFDLEKLTTYKFAAMYKVLADRNKILKAKNEGHGS